MTKTPGLMGMHPVAGAQATHRQDGLLNVGIPLVPPQGDTCEWTDEKHTRHCQVGRDFLLGLRYLKIENRRLSYIAGWTYRHVAVTPPFQGSVSSPLPRVQLICVRLSLPSLYTAPEHWTVRSRYLTELVPGAPGLLLEVASA